MKYIYPSIYLDGRVAVYARYLRILLKTKYPQNVINIQYIYNLFTHSKTLKINSF